MTGKTHCNQQNRTSATWMSSLLLNTVDTAQLEPSISTLLANVHVVTKTTIWQDLKFCRQKVQCHLLFINCITMKDCSFWCFLSWHIHKNMAYSDTGNSELVPLENKFHWNNIMFYLYRLYYDPPLPKQNFNFRIFPVL